MAETKVTLTEMNTALTNYTNTGSATSSTTETTNAFPSALTFTLANAATVEISAQTYCLAAATGMDTRLTVRQGSVAGTTVGFGALGSPGGVTWGDHGTLSVRAIVALAAGTYSFYVTDYTSASSATHTYRTAIARIIG